MRAVIHFNPLLLFLWGRAAGFAFGKCCQIGIIHFGVLGGIVGLEVVIADVVNYVVLFLRHHPGLRLHHPESVGEGLIHGERIVAVLELVLRKFQ